MGTNWQFTFKLDSIPSTELKPHHVDDDDDVGNFQE